MCCFDKRIDHLVRGQFVWNKEEGKSERGNGTICEWEDNTEDWILVVWREWEVVGLNWARRMGVSWENTGF